MSIATPVAGEVGTLVASFFGDTNPILTGVSGAGGAGWTKCPAVGEAPCHGQASSVTSVSVDAMYNLSLKASGTVLTATVSPAPVNGWYLAYIQFPCTSCGLVLDTLATACYTSSAVCPDFGAVTNPRGFPLWLHGTNDLIIHYEFSNAAGCSAVSSPYTGTIYGASAGIAWRTNTNTGAPPTWTCANGAAARGAIAFSDSAWSVPRRNSTIITGPTTITGPTAIQQFYPFQSGFEELYRVSGASQPGGAGTAVHLTIVGNPFVTRNSLMCGGILGATQANGYWDNIPAVSGNDVTVGTIAGTLSTYTSGGTCLSHNPINVSFSLNSWDSSGDSTNQFWDLNTNPSFVYSGNKSLQLHYSIDQVAQGCSPNCTAQDHNLSLIKNFDSTTNFAVAGGLTHFWTSGRVYFATPVRINLNGSAGVQRKIYYWKDEPGPGGTPVYSWATLLTLDDTETATSVAGLGTCRGAAAGDCMALRLNSFGGPGFGSCTLNTLDVNSYPIGPGTCPAAPGHNTTCGLKHNAWYKVKVEQDANHPGYHDGTLNIWVAEGNGADQLVYSNNYIELRAAGCNTGWTAFELGRQDNIGPIDGSHPIIIEDYRYWDDVIVSDRDPG